MQLILVQWDPERVPPGFSLNKMMQHMATAKHGRIIPFPAGVEISTLELEGDSMPDIAVVEGKTLKILRDVPRTT